MVFRHIVVLLVAFEIGSAFEGTTAAPEPTNPSVYEERRKRNWCGPNHEVDPLPALDDPACAKRFPPFFDRDFHCPSTWPSGSMRGFHPPTIRADSLDVLPELATIVPMGTSIDAKVAVGVLRRENAGMPPLVRYLGNGAERVAHQPWSSSKVFAAAHAAARLRAIQPNLGLDAAAGLLTDGVALSDMLTIIASYDVNTTRPGVTSNALGAYFQSLGGHAAAKSYLHETIGSNTSESFGGTYGEPVPPSLGYTLRPGSAPNTPVRVPPDPVPIPPISNSMSCLTMAEWLRRIVCTREDADSGHAAALGWTDSSAMLYGSPSSALFPGLQWGGLSMGTDIYLQDAVDFDAIEARSNGLWRIFSKLGAGVSSTAHPGQFEITLNAYGCFPVVAGHEKELLASVPGRGVEFVLSAAVVGKDSASADAAMRVLVANVSNFLLARYDRGETSP